MIFQFLLVLAKLNPCEGLESELHTNKFNSIVYNMMEWNL